MPSIHPVNRNASLCFVFLQCSVEYYVFLKIGKFAIFKLHQHDKITIDKKWTGALHSTLNVPYIILMTMSS